MVAGENQRPPGEFREEKEQFELLEYRRFHREEVTLELKPNRKTELSINEKNQGLPGRGKLPVSGVYRGHDWAANTARVLRVLTRTLRLCIIYYPCFQEEETKDRKSHTSKWRNWDLNSCLLCPQTHALTTWPFCWTLSTFHC